MLVAHAECIAARQFCHATLPELVSLKLSAIYKGVCNDSHWVPATIIVERQHPSLLSVVNVIDERPGLQVHVPLYDPSSVLQLVVCSAQAKVHKARVLTRAVRSMLTQVPTPSPPVPHPLPSLPHPHSFHSLRPSHVRSAAAYSHMLWYSGFRAMLT